MIEFQSAHLKPLDREDKKELSKSKRIWNVAAKGDQKLSVMNETTLIPKGNCS
jgi:hypothetical protein